MKFSLKQQVNGLIIFAVIGMFISFPFQDYFIGGLLLAACTAATIGGLADSFAVSALFGQPLRIPWPRWMGTNIITRNRQRLINELVDMVEHELLSTEMIKKQLKQYNATQTLANYISSPAGQQSIKQLSTRLIVDLIKLGNPAVVSLALKRLFIGGLNNTQPVNIVGRLLRWLIDAGHDATVVKAISKQLGQFIEQPAVKQFVNEFIATAIRSYEHNKKGRQFVNNLAGLNAEELTTKLFTIASNILSELEQGKHEWNYKLRVMLEELLTSWEQSEEQAELWNSRIRTAAQFLIQQLISGDKLEKWKAELLKQLQSVEESGEVSGLLQWLEQKIDELLHKLVHGTGLLNGLNDYIVNSLITFIERNHSYIGTLVRIKLEQFDADQLIELVQEKAGKDLQYIRLNGTLVGSLIGMLLYVLQELIGGLML